MLISGTAIFVRIFLTLCLLINYSNAVYAFANNEDMARIQATNIKNATLMPNSFNDKNKIFSLKYPLTWIFQIKTPTYVLFSGPEDSQSYLSLVGIHLFNYEQYTGLLDFLTSGGKKYEGALRNFFPTNIYTNLKFIQGEPITVKSASHIDLPAYSFVATYNSEKGEECKLWGVFIARPANPRYILFLYIDDQEHYKIYLPLVKAIFNTLSIN